MRLRRTSTRAAPSGPGPAAAELGLVAALAAVALAFAGARFSRTE